MQGIRACFQSPPINQRGARPTAPLRLPESQVGAHSGPGKITARWVASNSFGDVFKTTSDTACGTLLASKPTASGHVAVEMPGRPAECALYCPQAGDCDSRCTGNSFTCP